MKHNLNKLALIEAVNYLFPISLALIAEEMHFLATRKSAHVEPELSTLIKIIDIVIASVSASF